MRCYTEPRSCQILAIAFQNNIPHGGQQNWTTGSTVILTTEADTFDFFMHIEEFILQMFLFLLIR